MPSATPLLKDLLSSQKTNYYYNKTQTINSSRKQYRQDEEVSQFEKYDLHSFEHQNIHENNNFQRHKHLSNELDDSLSRELLEKEEIIKETSLNLSKRFDEEMGVNILNNQYKNNNYYHNHPLTYKNGYDLKNPNNTLDSQSHLKSNEINNRPTHNFLKNIGELGKKHENEVKSGGELRFGLVDEDDTPILKISTLESTYKREDSPDIDRLQIKEDKYQIKAPNYVGNSAKWYKIVCVKDERYFSVVRNL